MVMINTSFVAKKIVGSKAGSKKKINRLVIFDDADTLIFEDAVKFDMVVG